MPEWPPLTTAAVPVVVQLAKVPVSKPGLAGPVVGGGGGVDEVTVRLAVEAWLPEGAVPVTVKTVVWAGAEAEEATVSVEVPAPVIEAGLKVPVRPVVPPSPVDERLTVWAEPEVTPVVTV